jgi:hypothetical protein
MDRTLIRAYAGHTIKHDPRTIDLTFESLAVTLHTTWFNIKKFYVVPTLRLCVLCGSQNKQQLLPYKILRDWFYNRSGECSQRGTH